MATDALKKLAKGVPNWLEHLDGLSAKIEQHQAELADTTTAGGERAKTNSLRNKGSTETLKPNDDNPQMDNPDNTDETIPGKSPPVTSEPLTPTAEAKKSHTAAPPPSPSAAQQPREGINAVRARQRQQVKGQRSAPMMPAEDSPQTHRTGGMTIVYYDGYVQGFFGDLVKFISSSRYLMRRAKLAAKVAQLKKLAEVDHGDENALEKLCWLSSTRQYNPISSMTQPRSGHGGKDQHLSAYDKIDKRLEIVQSLCEHGAHQFLRDADCNEEIRKAHVQLKEAMEIATRR